MTTQIDEKAPTSSSEMGPSINYAEEGFDRTVEFARQLLPYLTIVTIENFPRTKEDLFRFGRALGVPMRKFSSSGTRSVEDFIGDVRNRSDLALHERLPTQGSEEIGFHTARAYAANRPVYFAMLMIDPGIVGIRQRSGESMLVRWSDVVRHFKDAFPLDAPQDLALLSTVPVSYRPWYVKEPVAFEPLIRWNGGPVEVRYWESLVSTLDGIDSGVRADEWSRYVSAVRRFDSAIRSYPSIIEYQMRAGQLTVVDNRHVAHARRPFVEQVQQGDGSSVFNSRRMFTMHLGQDRTN